MRSLSLFSLPFLIYLNPCAQPWYPLNSGTTNDLPGISFINANVGFSAGFNGTIVKTTNGGSSWFLPGSGGPLPTDLYDISAANQDTGWIVGPRGFIGKTVNGGTSGFSQISNTPADLFFVFALDVNTAWAGGFDYNTANGGGVLLHTVNGGANWSIQMQWRSYAFFDAFFLNRDTGWTVASVGIIRKTVDGGTTWSLQQWGNSEWFSVFFLNADTGWIAGAAGGILKSTNGGTTWALQNSGTTETLYSIRFINANVGWAVGRNGMIRKTTDGGTNWGLEISGTTDSLFSLSCVGSTCWAAGVRGTILTNVAPTPIVSKNHSLPRLEIDARGRLWLRTANAIRTSDGLFDVLGRFQLNNTSRKISLNSAP